MAPRARRRGLADLAREEPEAQGFNQEAPAADMARNFFESLQGCMQRNTPTPQVLIEQFRRFQPQRFYGKEDPMATEEWIAELERIFEHMELSEQQKVSCARFQLAADAAQWWKSQERTLTDGVKHALTWGEFKDFFLNRYFPQTLRDEKEVEFMSLKQGVSSVAEYESRFNNLSNYAPHLVDTKERKARRFERRLRPEIGGIVSGLRLPSYREVFERAQIVSLSLGLEYNQKSAAPPQKRKWVLSTENQFNTQERNVRPQIIQPPIPDPKPLCPNCNKPHIGECLRGRQVCYRCHQPGHRYYECTAIGSGNPQGRNIITPRPTERKAKAPTGNDIGKLNALPGVSYAEEKDGTTNDSEKGNPQ